MKVTIINYNENRVKKQQTCNLFLVSTPPKIVVVLVKGTILNVEVN